MLKEPTEITRARDFQDSLVRLSSMRKHSASLIVRKRILESWATTILYHAAGLKVGDSVPRKAQAVMKKPALELMPVFRPSQLQGDSSQGCKDKDAVDRFKVDMKNLFKR